ncbi:apyrase-like isoform X4 [Cannabis sativa]|uniref:apyrase-like isoform X4 n=1 Tax=Cannabis sativa TaxID=3483 RepID=UPI0029CA0D8A|nr:apyrase-like isoform X4 [Cannabis sativa]
MEFLNIFIPPHLLGLGATAGLRSLSGNTSEEILEAVRNLIKEKSDFKLGDDDAVAVLDGIQEGSFLWCRDFLRWSSDCGY